MDLAETATHMLAEVSAKLAISETLARYSRGIDRCDLDTLKSAFWPDGIANYCDGDLNAWAWCETVIPALRSMARTQHAISNILIHLEGERATAETYCRAYHEVHTPEGNREMMVGGRYLDRFECRAGQWRILHRQYAMDFNQNGPSSAIWDSGLYAGLKVVGRRYPEDPLYSLGLNPKMPL